MDEIRVGIYSYVIGALLLDGLAIFLSAKWLAGRHRGLIAMAVGWVIATVAVPAVYVLLGPPHERLWGVVGILPFRAGFLALGGLGAFRELWSGQSGLG